MVGGKLHLSPPPPPVSGSASFDHFDGASLSPPLMPRSNEFVQHRVFEDQSKHINKQGVVWKRIKKWSSAVSLFMACIVIVYVWRANDNHGHRSLFSSWVPFSTKSMQRKIIVQAVPENYDDERIKIFSSALLSNDNNWEYRIYTPSDRILFLEKFEEFCFPNVPVKSIMKQYHALPHDFLKIELWKQCVLATGLAQGYIDYHQVHILDDTYKLLESESSVIIRLPVEKSSGDHDNINTKYMVNTALIINRNEALISASQKMSRFLFETPISTWTSERMSSLLVGYEFYQALGDVSKLDVKWLEPKCQNMAEASSRNLHKEPIRFIDLDSSSDNTAVTLSFLPTNFCPNSANSPCCHVIISETETASTPIWFLLQHPLMASYDKDNESRQAYMLQKSPELKLVTVKPDEMDYISVVVPSDVDIAPDLDDNDAYQSMTPNFFQLLLENECLPTQKECHRCLQRASPEGESADCQKCANKCGCYCSVLCKLRPPPKRVAHRFTIHPPKLKRDVHRLIPKLVHQTWFEEVHSSKYPNMSRLMESWKTSGWEYHFYDDDSIAKFLIEHFPPQIKEAYDAILPGAFKADLFRYCLLLIRGGVYADMDVLLEANLDEVIADDVGFMVPIDEPGVKVNRRSCLWNGLIAVAPGHPFIAQTIETVVNNIRNRFTSVDYDDMLCPNPVMHVSHTVDTLFTCGPCIMGASLNKVLGRHLQTQFEVGEIDLWQVPHGKNSDSLDVPSSDPRLSIPGRSIILKQDKNDMGAHRFTLEETHLLIAATDMPDYDDRPPTLGHYSQTHSKSGVYGVKKLYKDSVVANELIEISIENQVT